MKTTASVEQDVDFVEDVYLLSETDDAVIALINTNMDYEKYPEVGLYNCVSIIFRDNIATVRFHDLPFKSGGIIYLTGRHCVHVCIYSLKLERDLSFNNGGKTLFTTNYP